MTKWYIYFIHELSIVHDLRPQYPQICLQGMPTGTIDGINFFHLPGHPHNTMCLEEAGVAEADAVIIGPADDLNAKEASLQSSCQGPSSF